MAGNYPANKSFTVIGTLADKFTSIEFSATVATESVVMSYDKDGCVGIGKVVEQGKAGSLDVAGDIFAGNKPIQHHQLTDNAGSAFNDYSSDFDANIISGYYHKSASAPNNPSGRWGLLHVIRGGTHVVQYFAERDGKRTLFLRAKTNGNWTNWVEYAKADHPNLVNTGWVGIGNGFSYKRLGDTVYLRYRFDTNGVQRFSPGTMPVELIPGNMMFPITSWTFSPDRLIHIQVNADGRVEWINQSQWRFKYEGQISWAI